MGCNENELTEICSFNDDKVVLQHDKNNNLYVNGKRLITQQKVELRRVELILSIIVTASVATEAIIAIFKAVN